MIWLEVLVEGVSDVPTIKEILERKFELTDGKDFAIHWHCGRGTLPADPHGISDPKRLGLLDQLPSKLRVYAKRPPQTVVVLVIVDSDKTPCVELLRELNVMLAKLPEKPQVLFRLVVEEIESWFISDINALRSAYPKRLDKTVLKGLEPDAIVGAWEKLAKALKFEESSAGPGVKLGWAEKISPYLNLDQPRSPSLRKFIEGVDLLVKGRTP
ncbi:MAG: DUF4276 family protein [Polaromonas sp.]